MLLVSWMTFFFLMGYNRIKSTGVATSQMASGIQVGVCVCVSVCVRGRERQTDRYGDEWGEVTLGNVHQFEAPLIQEGIIVESASRFRRL